MQWHPRNSNRLIKNLHAKFKQTSWNRSVLPPLCRKACNSKESADRLELCAQDCFTLYLMLELTLASMIPRSSVLKPPISSRSNRHSKEIWIFISEIKISSRSLSKGVKKKSWRDFHFFSLFWMRTVFVRKNVLSLGKLAGCFSAGNCLIQSVLLLCVNSVNFGKPPLSNEKRKAVCPCVSLILAIRVKKTDFGSRIRKADSCDGEKDSPTPADSMREAVSTVSPNKQYRGILVPTTPATTGPITLKTTIL